MLESLGSNEKRIIERIKAGKESRVLFSGYLFFPTSWDNSGPQRVKPGPRANSGGYIFLG